MKRIIPIALTLVFAMTYFMNSFAYGDTVITKWTSNGDYNGETNAIVWDCDEDIYNVLKEN